MTGTDRELRDHLEQVQARARMTGDELQSALRTAYDLQNQLQAARAQIATLEQTLTEVQTKADESAEVRDLLAAAITTRFTVVPSGEGFGKTTLIAVIALLLFLLFLFGHR